MTEIDTKELVYKKAMLLGRLLSGMQSGHGIRVHAVILKQVKRPPCLFNDWGHKAIPNDDYRIQVGMCGAKPGRRSVGWINETDLEVTCPKCLFKLVKVNDKGRKTRVVVDFSDISCIGEFKG
jgi:hypothetical protein